MSHPAPDFDAFFAGKARDYLLRAVHTALEEDGRDLTSLAVFAPSDRCRAEVVAKQEAVAAGLPLIPLVLDLVEPGAGAGVELLARDGEAVRPGWRVARMECGVAALLKAERVLLNFVCHLSGVATLTRRYVQELAGTRARLLDTRKTLPGLRHAEKYAVLCGGGANHRMDLEELLMLKDNHLDRAGGVAPAVEALRRAYSPCPAIEVECRNRAEVLAAVESRVQRIMLDNMDLEEMRRCLALIPPDMESEVSGGVDLGAIRDIARLGPTFISVGRLTHSAPAADFSLRMERHVP